MARPTGALKTVLTFHDQMSNAGHHRLLFRVALRIDTEGLKDAPTTHGSFAPSLLSRVAASDDPGRDLRPAFDKLASAQLRETGSRMVTNSSAAVGWIPIVASN